MRFCFVFLSMVFFAFSANGQFSVQYKYGITSSNAQDEHSLLVDDNQVMQLAHEIGLAYWMKLKERRVEFHPSIVYSTNQDAITTIDGPSKDYNWQSFYLEVPVHIYPLDFDGDCNCPTFSKDGNVFEKGVFVYAAPAVGYHLFDNTYESGSFIGTDAFTVETNNSAINFRGTVGVGIDIGLGDLLTITPSVGFAYATAVQLDLLDGLDAQVTSVMEIESSNSYTQFMPALRLTFRPDYLKERRGMFR